VVDNEDRPPENRASVARKLEALLNRRAEKVKDVPGVSRPLDVPRLTDLNPARFKYPAEFDLAITRLFVPPKRQPAGFRVQHQEALATTNLDQWDRAVVPAEEAMGWR